MDYTVKHEDRGARGAFFIEQEGRRVAVMTYVAQAGSDDAPPPAKVVVVDHTRVDPSLGGQGVGRRLLDAFVAWARATGTKAVPECSYVKVQFDRDPSIRDVLA